MVELKRNERWIGVRPRIKRGSNGIELVATTDKWVD